jgi:hypothetical protein
VSLPNDPLKLNSALKNQQKQGIDTNKAANIQPEKLAKIRPIVYL